jgi:TorA maturation chaperone TorD
VRASDGVVRADDFYDDLPPATPAEPELPEEELWRAHLWASLGALMARAPDAQALARLAAAPGDDGSEIGAALALLAEAARRTDAERVADEYAALFVGLTRGEFVPYASYYLTGFLHEKPLAKLRSAMAELGIAARDGVAEPEDHIGALAEMMAGLITGAFGRPADLAAQQRFFEDHIAPWAGRFFEDLEKAASAEFYKPVGTLGRALVGIETQAFAMAA